MIKIDKGVPVPVATKSKGAPKKYPFEEMDVGDSFFVVTATKRAHNTVMSSASHYGKSLHRQFVSRKMDGGVRVWRIK